jgi:hypothetical protein
VNDFQTAGVCPVESVKTANVNAIEINLSILKFLLFAGMNLATLSQKNSLSI